MFMPSRCVFFFFFNDTATTEIYTLSLHDALPISGQIGSVRIHPTNPNIVWIAAQGEAFKSNAERGVFKARSEEHTSELQSRLHLVCRLLLEKKNRVLNMSSHQPTLSMSNI